MSNSIWKMQDVKPDIDKQIIVKNDFDYIIYFGKCAVAPGNKWCYVDEIIAQADKAKRLQKAVDVSVDMLKGIDWCAQDYAKAQEALNEIKQLIKETQ